jgi:uncharacterized protein (DUF2141 family)
MTSTTTPIEKGDDMIGSLRKLTPALLLVLGCSAWIGSDVRLAAQAPRTVSVTVHITGMRNAEGNLRVALRRDENAIVEGRTVDIDPKTLTAKLVFENVPEGPYGIAVIHDENKNGKLDFNEMGMPLEGYGYSNNPPKKPGPAPFEDTKFTLTAPSASIEIALIYWP